MQKDRDNTIYIIQIYIYDNGKLNGRESERYEFVILT